MEVLQERLLANEGEGVRELRAEPPKDVLVRVETVELGGRREQRAGEREVLYACRP